MRSLRRIAPPVLAIVLLGGCTASPGPDTRPDYLNLTRVIELTKELHCDTSEVINADMNWWGDMKGVDCFYTNGDAVLLRAYQSQNTAKNALSDLAPVINAENQVLVGANWFANGAPRRLRLLTNRNLAPEPRSKLEVASPPPIDPRSESLGACTSYVASVVRTALFQPGDWDLVTANSDQTYPGLRTIAKQLADEIEGGSTTAENVDARIAEHADSVRQFCLKLYG